MSKTYALTPLTIPSPIVPKQLLPATNYDLWLSLGNKGTLAQYLASLVGPAGSGSGTVKTTPYTPLALLGMLPLWLDASDLTTLTLDSMSRVLSWRSKGDSTLEFVPPDLSSPGLFPIWANGRVFFNNTPLVCYSGVPALTDFLLSVVCTPSSQDTDSLLLNLGFYAAQLRHATNQYTGNVFPSDGKPVMLDATLDPAGVMLSRQMRNNISRLAINGGDPNVRTDNTARATTPAQLNLCGYRGSDAKITSGFVGSLSEVVLTNQPPMNVLRKLEGYNRVAHETSLPADHIYFTDNPIVEDLHVPSYAPYLV